MKRTKNGIIVVLASVTVLLLLSLVFAIVPNAYETAFADELEAIDGADVKIVTRFEDSPEVPKCEITFADGRYLHLNPDTNVPVVNDDSAGADMEFYEGVLTIFYNDDVEAYHYKGLELWALNTTAKKFILAVSEYLNFNAFDYPNGDLTVTTADGVTESTTVSIPHSVRVSGTLTVAGYARLSVNQFLGIHTNEDYVTKLEAYRLRLVDNATVEADADEERHAIKVTHLSLDTEGSLIAAVWAQDCISALKVDAEEIDLVKCREIRIRSYTKHGDLTTLTNVPYLRNSADEPLPGWHCELQKVTDGLRLILVPQSAVHTISFEPNGGEGEMEPVEAYYTYYTLGNGFTPPAGMRFAGWSLTPDGEKVSSFELTEDVTLYALWETSIAQGSSIVYGYLTDYANKTYNPAEYDATTGVLTLDKDFNTDISVGIIGGGATRQDITIRFVGQHNYGINSPDNHFCIWARKGDVTLEGYGEEPITVYLGAIVTNYSLTIKGNLNVVVTGGLRGSDNNMTITTWSAFLQNGRSRGVIHAGDTFSILDDCSLTAIDPEIHSSYQNNSSLLTAKYMVFDTTGEVRVGTTTNVYNDSQRHTSICVWDTEASNSAQIYDRITIRRCGEDGCLKLYRYNDGRSSYSTRYLFFAYTPVDTADLYYGQDVDNLHYLNQTTDYTEGGVNAQLLTLKPVNVDFDANGGEGEMARDYARFDEDYILPECAFEAPEGLTWVGWSVEGGELVSSDTTFHVESDMDSVTVTAMWACTVTYRANDGSGESVGIHNVVLGEYTLLDVEELGFSAPKGKNFAGWAYSAQGDVIGTEVITLTDNVELYAIWVNLHDHTMQAHAAVQATCTQAGNSAYWYCTGCEKCFSDAEGNTEIELETTVIAALGHDYGDWQVVTPSTETQDGLERRVCSRDENHVDERIIPRIGHVHSIQAIAAKAATCTQTGESAHYECTGCHHYYSDELGEHEINVEDFTIAALGHDYGEWTVTTPAQIGIAGEETRVCSRDENHKETRPINALPYEYKEEGGVNIYEATATAGVAKDVTTLFEQAKANNGKVELTVGTLVIAFNANAVNAIGGNAATLTANVMTENLDVEGAQLVVEVNFTGTTFANGKATISLPFTMAVPEGKVAKVYYVNGNEKTDMGAVFADGKVTFETDHFSKFAVVFENEQVSPVDPQPTEPDQPEVGSDKKGLSGGAIAGIVIAIVVAIAGAGLGCFFLLKKKGVIGKKATEKPKEEPVEAPKEEEKKVIE